jgi:hypothetical protein
MSKKTYSKSELAKKAVDVFKTYPTAEKIFASNDGQFFLEENRAALHAKSLKKGQYFEIENEGEASADNSKDSKSKSAEDLIADAKDIETTEAVEAAIVLETEGKNRKTVLAAYDARIQELKADK